MVVWLIYKENEKNTRFLKLSILFHIICLLFIVFYDLQLLIYYRKVDPRKYMLAAELYYFFHPITLISFPVMFVTFLLWLKRIISNMDFLTKRKLRVISGKVDIYHLVPILHLYKPYIALKDAYNIFDLPQKDFATTDEQVWKQMPTPSKLIPFWSTFWAAIALKLYAVFHTDWLALFSSDIGFIYQSQPLYYLTDLMLLFSYVYFYQLVLEISERHLSYLQKRVLEEYRLDSIR